MCVSISFGVFLQSNSGQIRYSIRGIDPTPDAANFFVIGPTDGVISIAKLLSTDTRTTGVGNGGKRPVYYIEVNATDQGIPKQSSTARVQINVLRNINEPVFPKTIETIEVDESRPPGSVILNITATDSDALRQPGVSSQGNLYVRHHID